MILFLNNRFKASGSICFVWVFMPRNYLVICKKTRCVCEILTPPKHPSFEKHVKFVQTNRQTDGRTDRRTAVKQYAPDLSIRGHKKCLHRVSRKCLADVSFCHDLDLDLDEYHRSWILA